MSFSGSATGRSWPATGSTWSCSISVSIGIRGLVRIVTSANAAIVTSGSAARTGFIRRWKMGSANHPTAAMPTGVTTPFKIKGGEKREIEVPSFVRDIAKVQVYCAWAQVLLGERAQVLHPGEQVEPDQAVVLQTILQHVGDPPLPRRHAGKTGAERRNEYGHGRLPVSSGDGFRPAETGRGSQMVEDFPLDRLTAAPIALRR